MLEHGSININRGLLSCTVHKDLVSRVVHKTWGAHLFTGLEARTCPQGSWCTLVVHRGLKARTCPQGLRRALVHKGLVSRVVHRGLVSRVVQKGLVSHLVHKGPCVC